MAAGGFTITGLVYLGNWKTYKPIIRPTVVTAFLGYVLVSAGLMYDLGRPWNIWHPLIMWNPHSVMFEVAWCVMLYSTVLAAEFSPMVFEKLGWKGPLHFIKSVTLVLVVGGVLLSTLHQSSLGTVFLLVPKKLYPLWYTPILPILFFMSAVTIGFAMVILESYLSAKLFRRSLERQVVVDVGRFLLVALVLYLAIKLQDVYARGVGGLILLPRLESYFYWAEMFLVLAPIIILAHGKARMNKHWLFIAAALAILGVILNRFNVSMIGLYASAGAIYVPSGQEVIVSVFLVTAGIIGFYIICRYLPVFPESENHDGAPSPS
jgi:Ni/Fe-hydrogenase subunit HybB-like protein